MNLTDLSLHFSDNHLEGYQFISQIIPGEAEVLQVIVDGFDEIPIYISMTDKQILCITYLWSENEVKPETKSEMLEAMLDFNIPMPLSAFSRIQDRYVIFGALSINSRVEDVTHEVIALCENSIDILEDMSHFLK